MACERSSSPVLSRREREIMDIVYAQGQSTAAQVREAMADPPTDAAVRATLRTLLEKGHLKHKEDGPRYLYMPTTPRKRARKSALRHVLHTFFGGSTESVMTALLELEGDSLTDKDRERLKRLIDAAKKAGR